MKGTVKRWNRSIGYGFIEADEGGDEILVHHSNLGDVDDLQEGQRVEFEVDTTQPRPRAVRVTLIV